MIPTLPTHALADGDVALDCQTTLRSAISCRGIGLHSGAAVTLRLLPAAADQGIVFRRVDLAGSQPIPARFDAVVETRLCTVLGGDDGASVATVEHLMAALSASGIDNAEVEIDGPEVPILDGSAEPFCFLIGMAGTARLPAPRRFLRVRHPVTVQNGEAWASLTPAPVPGFSIEIDFAAPAIGRQRQSLVLSSDAFRQEIAAARTFTQAGEIAAMQAQGLARGGSLDNAVVVDGDRVLNADGWRFANECARHKLLDAVGDMALAGLPMLASYSGNRAGHALNNRLLRALFADTAAWMITGAERSPIRAAA